MSVLLWGILAVVDLATLRSLAYYTAIYGVVVAVAIWIYRDSRDRNIGSPIVWALATLVFTILPVLVYLFVRQRTAESAPFDGDS